MTAVLTNPDPVRSTGIKKDYKGGWKDRALRSNPAAFGTPLTGPVRISSIWTDPDDYRPKVVGGIMFTKSGKVAFEVCDCRQPNGVWYVVETPGSVPDSRILHRQERVYAFGKCRCIPSGATLKDAPSVPLERLVTGQALAVVRKVGVGTTHELADFGYEEFETLPGVGPLTVHNLRVAIRDAGLPEWRAR